MAIEQRTRDLAETLVEVARILLSEHGEQQTLERIVALAVATIPGCDHAGVTIVRGDRVTTPAASDEVPLQVDKIQYEVGDGPCLSAIRDEPRYQSDDLMEEDRWPSFAHRTAAETGVRSMLSFRLFAHGDTLGSLNLYSRQVAAFTEDDRVTGVMFAAHAAMALVSARVEQQVEELQYGLVTRGDIGRAVGILMVQRNITGDAALDVLRVTSQRENVKLRDIAARVITGQEELAGARVAGADPAAAMSPVSPESGPD